MSEVELKYKNKEAENELVIPVSVVCNTPFEVLASNIIENSKACSKWLKLEPEHDGTAIICGSGPSIKKYVDDIKNTKGTIFALNGACGFLNNNGIIPDYQIIIDAKKENVSLVGDADGYLFGATVNKDVLNSVDEKTIFQLQTEDDELQQTIEDLANGDFAQIYSSVSVGLSACSVAFALGYRKLELYGYDSSNSGKESHAVHQSMNDDNPMMSVEFNGKTYDVSIAMKLQADRFQELALSLKANGCEVNVHGEGLLPDMYNCKEMPENEKYSRLWTMQQYRRMSPAHNIVDLIEKNIFGTVLDFGCGTARAALELTKRGHNVICVDFTPNSRDSTADHLPFLQWDLTKKLPISGDSGYCVDVMEHIEPKNVDAVIINIMGSAGHVFFQISTIPDKMGVLIGQQLHLTVEKLEWWKNKFNQLGFTVHDEQETEIDCNFIAKRK